MSSPDPSRIRLAAMNLLARREHSLQELRQKLARRFDDPEVLEEQLQRLAEEGLQCDRRFAESFARQRIGRGHGPLRIEREARQRGIAESELRRALAELAPDWEALAAAAMAKKFGDGAATEPAEQARRARFLQYRGFALEHFRELL